MNAFGRNAIVLMTGSGIAQAIPVLVSPILTRLYSPAEFGIFGLYMALTQIALVFVTGRYELAIVVPKDDVDGMNMLGVSVMTTIVVSVLLLIVIALYGDSIAVLLQLPAASGWLYFVPLTALVLGIQQSLIYWSNRQAAYNWMAWSRIGQAGAASSAQLAGGWAALGNFGLIVGQLIGHVASAVLLACLTYKRYFDALRRLRVKGMVAVATQYVAFPKYLVIAHGLNTGSGWMPVVLLASFSGSIVAGHYTVMQRVIEAPLGVVAGAIGDVFRQEASRSYATNGECKSLYLWVLVRLLGIAVIPFTVLFFFAPSLFSFVFGAQWRVAGEYAQILTPLFFMRFVTTPLSSMFLIAQAQRLDLLWQVGLFTLVISSFIIGFIFFDIRTALILFCASYCLMYALNGVVSYRLAAGRS